MGARYKSTSFPYGSDQELGRRFADLQASDEREFGTDPYSGSWATIQCLSIDRSRTFHSIAEAGAYLSDALDKGHAMAVLLVQSKPTAAALRNADAVRAKARKIELERLYPLTGQTVSESGYVSSPSWERAFAGDALARVRIGKSRTKGCGACGSSISVSHIRRVECPVCGAEFLLTESDRRRRDRVKARIAEIEKTVKALVADAKRIEDESRAKATDTNRYWYVGGVAAE